MTDTQVTVQYERKFSDGNYGSEGLSMSWSVTYEDSDSEWAAEPDTVRGRCEVITSALRDAVLSELTNSACHAVANAADRELNPPPPARPRPVDDLLEVPF